MPVPRLTAPAYTTLVHGEILHLAQRTQSLTARLEHRLAQHPLRDALVAAHLEIESDASACERRAGHPDTRVRNAEIGHRALIARRAAALRALRLAGGEHGRWRKSRLRTRREEDLAQRHTPSEQLRERAQRERNPGETCTARGASRGERKTPRIREPRGEGARRGFRPLTAEVSLI